MRDRNDIERSNDEDNFIEEDNLLNQDAETSFTDDGKTVTVVNKENEDTSYTLPSVPNSEVKSTYYIRPRSYATPTIEGFIRRIYKEGFKFRETNKTIKLLNYVERTSYGNINFRPLTTADERSKKMQIVLKRDGNGVLQYNDANVAAKAVRQFKEL